MAWPMKAKEVMHMLYQTYVSVRSPVVIALSLLIGCSGVLAGDTENVKRDAAKDVAEVVVDFDSQLDLRQFDSLTADEILGLVAKMHRTYETIGTKGFVTTQRGEQKPRHHMGIEWTYRRPNRFHFNYQKNPDVHRDRCLAFFDETEIRLFTDESRVALFVPWESRLEDPVGSLLAGIQSCTKMLPYVLYLLLHDDALSAHLLQLENLERLPNEKKGLIPCFRIRGTLSGSLARTVTFWVSAETFTVERIIEHIDENGEPVVITTELVSVVNVDYCDSFDFPWNPPKGVEERRYPARESSRNGVGDSNNVPQNASER
jgi:outer membrane lipoprotein-sorting protein